MLDTNALWARMKTDAAGLVTAVVQHASTGEVLMVGYMNATALDATLRNRRVTFWSRSRDELWEKGATSGHTLELVAMRLDCDRDALLVLAEPKGPTCHTGARSCFYRRIEGEDAESLPEDEGPGAPWLG